MASLLLLVAATAGFEEEEEKEEDVDAWCPTGLLEGLLCALLEVVVEDDDEL